jgi:sterol desaturase/sphingolipid hydroxylase (fatty acid hydroxylase superfamily)
MTAARRLLPVADAWRLTKFSYYLDFGIYPVLIVMLVLLKHEIAGPSLGWLRWWVVGFVAWTLIEYWLHRLVFHGLLPAIARMHMLHHANPSAWIGVPVWYSLVFFVAGGVPLVFLFGVEAGIGLTIGLLIGYTLYIGIHDAAHHRSSYLWPWFSRLRINHLRHHHQNAQAGFGVTSDFWDRLFGTKI